MRRYQRTHEGKVIVERDGLLYIDTEANFIADGGALIGAAGVIVEDDRGARRVDAAGNQVAAGITTASADAVIDGIAALLSARAARVVAAESARIAALPRDKKREHEYNARGATEQAMVIALWEKIVEGKSAAADTIETIRQGVKGEIP